MEENFAHLTLNFPLKTEGLFLHVSGSLGVSLINKNGINLVFYFWYFFEDRGYFLHLSNMLQMYFLSVLLVTQVFNPSRIYFVKHELRLHSTRCKVSTIIFRLAHI